MVDIKLYGPIEAETAYRVKAELESAGGDEIVVRIDSPGGSVFAGFSIWEAFSAYEGPKRAVIEAAAFSIAGFIATAFDDIEIVPNGYIMIHNPHVVSQGDADQLTKDAELLAK